MGVDAGLTDIVQCEPRLASDRAALNLKRPSHYHARQQRKLIQARDEFKAAGFKAFVKNPFEDERFAVLMGPYSLYDRLVADELHLVSGFNRRCM